MEHNNNSYAKRTQIFGMMIFIVVSILSLLSFISAAPSVTLNTPADAYVSPTVNVDFNCSATSSPEYMTNLSFWINSTGTWEINQSINFLNSSTEDSFDDGGTTLNASIWETYSTACTFGFPCFQGSTSYTDQVVGPPAYMRNYVSLWSGAGCNAGRYTAIRSRQDFNDGKFYNITFNMSYFSAVGQVKVSIVNASISGISWVGSCSTFNDISRDLLFYKTNPTTLDNNLYVLNINPNGTFLLYENGIIINNTVATKSEWYLEWSSVGMCTACGNVATYSNIYSYDAVSLGKQDTDLFSELFKEDFSKGDVFKWSCAAGDDTGVTTLSASNRTFSVGDVAPVINITYPTGTLSYAFVGQNLTFNWTVEADGTLDSCWFSYNSGGNISVTCSQNYSSIILTEIKSLTFYANDTANNLGSDTTTWNYSAIEHNFTHDESVYETDNQGFILNVSSDTINTAYLYYNGTAYEGSVDNSSGYNIVSVYIDTPLVTSVLNKTFYWLLNTASGDYTTTTHTQIVNPIYFTYCNSTYNVTYLNFTYKDEMQNFNINASVPNANFNYWLGDGAVTKSYYYTSYSDILTPNENSSTGFCLSPSDKTLNLNYVYQAGGSAYITRTFNSIVNFTLTNTTTTNTNKVLYLIQSADSGPVTIQVVDLTSGNVVQNARVTISRDIFGETINILDGYTDAAGTIATYLSSVVSYTITASKDGCGTNTQTVTPVGSYNIQLNCAGNLTPYVSYINGVTYQRSPASGISLQPGNTTFGYFVSSLFNPIVSARFELWDDTNTMVASNQTDVSSNYSSCNSVNCTLTIKYHTVSGDNIKGRYYINLGNATNNTYILLEKDAYWRYIFINENTSQQAWKKATIHFNDWMDVWGAQQGNCIIYNNTNDCTASSSCKWQNRTTYGDDTSFCILKDEINKMEFNRVLIIFFGIVIVLFIMGKGIRYEMTNPGSFVLFLSIIIVILSIGGMFTFSGLTPSDWLNQYIYAYICLTFALGYNLSIIRRYST